MDEFSVDKVKKVYKNLTNKEKRVADLLFGLNGKAKLSHQEICTSIGISEAHLDFIIENIKDKMSYLTYQSSVRKKEKKLKVQDDFYMVEKVDEETAKLIDQMSNVFYDMFKGVSEIQVENALELLSKKEKKIIYLYYGLDGIHCMDYDEIADKYKMSVDDVDELLENGVEKLKKIIKSGIKPVSSKLPSDAQTKKYMSLVSKYGKQVVDNLILKFGSRHAHIMMQYFKCEKTAKEILEEYHFNAYIGGKKILEIIEKLLLVENDNSVEKFYEQFSEFSKEEIDAAIENLSKTSKNIIKSFYGLGVEKKSIEEIVENNKVTTEQFFSVINTANNKIFKQLNKLKNNKKSIYDDFKAYPKEKVDEAIALLDVKNRNIIINYYGLYGAYPLGDRRLSEKYNINTSVGCVIRSIKQELNAMLIDLAVKSGEKVDINLLRKETSGIKETAGVRKYARLVSEYGENAVKEALLQLDEKTQDIFKYFCGIDCEPVPYSINDNRYNMNSNSFYYLINATEKRIEKIIVGKEQAKEKTTAEKKEKVKEKATIEKKEKVKKKTTVSKKREGRRKNSQIEFQYQKLVDEYGKESVDKAISLLTKEERELFSLYCGIDCDRMPASQLAKKYDVTSSSIYHRKTKIVESIIQIITSPEMFNKEEDSVVLENQGNQSVDSSLEKSDENKENGRRSYREKYSDLIAKYGQEVVDAEINALDDKKRDVLNLSLGINGCDQMSFKDIAAKYNNNIVYIRHMLAKTLAKIENNINDVQTDKSKDSRYKVLVEKFGEEKVKDALLKLNKGDRELFELYNGVYEKGLTADELAEKYKLKKGSLFCKLTKINKDIEKLIENPNFIEPQRSNRYLELVKKYGQEVTDSAFNVLKCKDKEVLNLYFGINGCSKMSIKSIAVKYNCAESTIHNQIKRALEQIENIINNVQVGENRDNKYKILVKKYGEEKVKVALSKLSKDHKELFELYNGVDGNSLTIDELAKKYKLKKSSIFCKLTKINKKVEMFIENPDFVINEDGNGYLDLVKDFGQELVDLVFDNLDEKDKEILNLYYGLNGKTKVSGNDLAKMYNYRPQRMYSKIERILSKMRFILGDEDKEKEATIRTTKYRKLIENYGEDNIKEALSQLTEDNQELFKLYFGVGCKIASIEELREKYWFARTRTEIDDRIYRIVTSVTKFVKSKKNPISKNDYSNIEKRQKEYDELVEKYGEDSVKAAVSKLNDRNSSIVKELFGIECDKLSVEQIMKKYDLSVDNLLYVILSSLKNIRGYINNPDKKSQRSYASGGIGRKEYEQLISQHGKERIEEIISSFGEQDKELLEYWFGKGPKVSVSQFLEKYNIKRSNYYALMSSKIKSIKKSLDGDASRNNKHLDKYKRFIEEYGQASIDVAFDKLSELKKGLLKSYLGLDGEILNGIELSQKYNISKPYIYAKIGKILNELEESLKNPDKVSQSDKKVHVERKQYVNLVEIYGKDQVEKAFSKLDKEEQRLLSDLGINGGKRMTMSNYKVKYNTILNYAKNALSKMVDFLEGREAIYYGEERKWTDKYVKMVEKYGKDEVTLVVDKLEEKEKELLNSYLGINGTKQRTVKELSKEWNVNPVPLHDMVNSILDKIIFLIGFPINENDLDNKKEKAYDRFAQNNGGKEQVEAAFSTLKASEKEWVKLYFVINDCDSASEIYGSLSKILGSVKNLIDENISVDETIDVRDTKYQTLIEKYGEKDVGGAYSTLEIQDQQILKLFYGVDCQWIEVSEIAKKFNITVEDVYVSVSSSIKSMEEFIKCNKAYEDTVAKYGMETIKNSFVLLDYDKKTLFKNYFGFGTEQLTSAELSKQYSSSFSEITGKIYKIINEIDQCCERLSRPASTDQTVKPLDKSSVSLTPKIEHKQRFNIHSSSSNKAEDESVERFYQLFKGKDRKKVDEAIEKLNIRNRDILFLYFGLKGSKMSVEDISKRFGIKEKDISKVINGSVETIREILNQKKSQTTVESESRDSKFKALARKYSLISVDESLKELSESERSFLVMYYSLNGCRFYSVKEIAEIIKVEENKIGFLEESILRKLEAIIVPKYKAVLIKKMRNEFKEKVPDLNKFKQSQAILERWEILLIALYYGLNDKDIMTLDELSEKFKLKKKQVLQYIDQIIEKINKYTPDGGRR